ncbi:hypothetical protein A2917_03150 [Candidatus Nomurabacteria bacterium RIFCSPLOWO2_01_FULL_42_17]|uniref:Uncharacterized protein n=1 Tax=Candidatus Nomurabacteria bacterium RIFCSPLOWO2_01_FULL_42_17 TaxID=1801780 RepID=A0A1F6XN27_9BACT|nr:MAG: hypothetical protein A2917_03150 [Candidatus Nomurabacteria bacterium RIFCSPLOWO2_01_FULL_42_17]
MPEEPFNGIQGLEGLEKIKLDKVGIENNVKNHIQNLEKGLTQQNKARYVKGIMREATRSIDVNPEYYEALQDALIKHGYLKAITAETPPAEKPKLPQNPPKPSDPKKITEKLPPVPPNVPAAPSPKREKIRIVLPTKPPQEPTNPPTAKIDTPIDVPKPAEIKKAEEKTENRTEKIVKLKEKIKITEIRIRENEKREKAILKRLAEIEAQEVKEMREVTKIIEKDSDKMAKDNKKVEKENDKKVKENVKMREKLEKKERKEQEKREKINREEKKYNLSDLKAELEKTPKIKFLKRLKLIKKIEELSEEGTLEKDEIENPFKYFLIKKIDDRVFECLYEKPREKITLEDINYLCGESGIDVQFSVVDFVTDARRNIAFMSSNGFLLQLQNKGEITTEENGRQVIGIYKPEAKYKLVTPKGGYFLGGALTNYTDGVKLLREQAQEYQAEQIESFKSQNK